MPSWIQQGWSCWLSYLGIHTPTKKSFKTILHRPLFVFVPIQQITKAVQSLSLTTLNYERSSILLQYFMELGEGEWAPFMWSTPTVLLHFVKHISYDCWLIFLPIYSNIWQHISWFDRIFFFPLAPAPQQFSQQVFTFLKLLIPWAMPPGSKFQIWGQALVRSESILGIKLGRQHSQPSGLPLGHRPVLYILPFFTKLEEID
jgi:hypothetical protein